MSCVLRTFSLYHCHPQTSAAYLYVMCCVVRRSVRGRVYWCADAPASVVGGPCVPTSCAVHVGGLPALPHVHRWQGNTRQGNSCKVCVELHLRKLLTPPLLYCRYFRCQLSKQYEIYSISISRHLKAFLAHLSTKCSWWAIVVSGCPSCVVVRLASSVVCQHLMFTL